MPKVVAMSREASRKQKLMGPSIKVDNGASTLLSQYNGDDFERLHEDEVLCEWTIFIHKVQVRKTMIILERLAALVLPGG